MTSPASHGPTISATCALLADCTDADFGVSGHFDRLWQNATTAADAEILANHAHLPQVANRATAPKSTTPLDNPDTPTGSDQ